MNLRYRLSQVRNSLFPPRAKAFKWIFIYGVPRSGTTYFYQELMQKSRLGVSDFDLGKFVPVIQHMHQNGYIPLDMSALKDFLRDQLLKHGAPGGGTTYDFIIKQVNTNAEEFNLLCELMGGAPEQKYFLYREPNGWLPSAMKKFGINEEEAEKMYEASMQSYEHIGGEGIEYGEGIVSALHRLGMRSLIPFLNDDKDNSTVGNQFQTIYRVFKASLANS